MEGRDGAGHDFQEFPHEFYGETYNQCASQARKRGWVVSKDRDNALCPKCSGKRKR